jgi:hypothetical protein
MNYLHQEKYLRDHAACRRLIFPVNPLSGYYRRSGPQPPARPPGLSLTPRNPGRIWSKHHQPQKLSFSLVNTPKGTPHGKRES